LDGTIVGAVGASAGTVEQDIAVAEAAIAALGHQAQSSRGELTSEKAMISLRETNTLFQI